MECRGGSRAISIEGRTSAIRTPGLPRAKAPPGPRGLDLIRLLPQIRHDRISVVETVAARYGDVAEIRLGPVRLVLVSDPEIAQSILRDGGNVYEKGIGLRESRYFLGDGLLTASGDAWRKGRTALSGLFRSDRLGPLLAITDAGLRKELDALPAVSGAEVDVSPLLARVALQTVAALAFGPGERLRLDDVLDDLQLLSRWAAHKLILPIDATTHLSWLMSAHVRAACARLAEFCGRMHRARLSDSPIHEAMGDHETADEQTMSDQILTLLLAGSETTTAVACWTLHLLSTCPAAAERVAQEVSAAGSGADFDAASSRLSYTRATIKEALRLYPPVWVLPRRAVQNTSIGPWGVGAGTQVLVNIYVMHRHPKFWPDAGRFIPERFLHDGPEPPAYMPFGIGARRCIGLHLGSAEATLMVARIVSRFHIAPGTRPVRPEAGLTLRPAGGLSLKLTPRH